MVTKKRYCSDSTAKNLLLYKMEQNQTFIENLKYDHRSLHKKLVCIDFCFYKSTQISINNGPSMPNPPYSGEPFTFGWSH